MIVPLVMVALMIRSYQIGTTKNDGHHGETIPSSNMASAAFSCSPAARKARAAISSILLLAAETSEVIYASLIPSQTKMQVGFLVCFLWFWPWQENSFVLRNIVLPLSHRSEPPSSKIVMRKEPGMLFSRKPTSLKVLSCSKTTMFQFPYQEPSAKPNLVLHSAAIFWNSTMIFFTLATIFGRVLRHLLLLQFQVKTSISPKITRCEA